MKTNQHKIISAGNNIPNLNNKSSIKSDCQLKSADQERSLIALQQMQDKENEESPQTLVVKPAQIKLPQTNNPYISSQNDEKESSKQVVNIIDTEEVEYPQDPPKQQSEAYLNKYKSHDSKDKNNDKSFTIVSDNSVKPRKGDINITPKSTNSKKIQNMSIDYNEDKKIDTNVNINQQQIINNNDISNEDGVKSFSKSKDMKVAQRKSTDNNSNQLDKSKLSKPPNDQFNNTQTSKFNLSKERLNISTCKKDVFDPEKLTYDLMKEYSQIKINKEASFIDRMQFDVFKREKQDHHIANLIEKNKPKLDEDELIKTFNRLILDANRRIEAQQNIEQMKSLLEEKLNNGKKYKPEEWKYIYNERFIKYVEEKNKKIEELFVQKQKEEKEKEEKQLELLVVKKGPQAVIDKAAQRLHAEGEKRNRRLEQKIIEKNKNELGNLVEKSSSSKIKNNVMDINDFKEKVIHDKNGQKIQIPMSNQSSSGYRKKAANKQDYNFQSDVDSENDTKKYKNSRISAEKVPNYNFKHNLNTGCGQKIEVKVSNNYKFSPSAKKDTKLKIKSKSKPLNKKPTNQYKTANINNGLQSQIIEFSSNEEDSICYKVPIPLEGTGQNKSIRTSDLKKNNMELEDVKNSFANKKYVTDLEASKFVDNILLLKLNKIK